MKKKCPNCKKKLPLSTGYWYKNACKPDGFSYWCKKCQIADQKTRRSNLTYQSFRFAKQRCTYKKYENYAYYGGRGIQMKFKCWEELEADIGPRKEGFTLDRIDVDGHYEPGNVRWATVQQQNQNRRSCVVNTEIVSNIRRDFSRGHTQTMLSLRYNINIKTVSNIVNHITWKEDDE